jgi:hypothetical protein
MDDDPDDLAAAFFRNQAAKEAAAKTIPMKDWIRIIGVNDPEKWLATTLPDSDHNANGIVGIILNGDNCSLEKQNNDVKEAEEYDKETRDKIKQLLVQKIESKLQQLDKR